jgi:hypothetical protein
MNRQYRDIDEVKEKERESQNAVARLAQWGIKNIYNSEKPALTGGESIGLNDL